MANITVSSSAELKAALKSVSDGDTISLKAGTYSGVSLHNAKFIQGITITSVDLENPAKITDLLLSGVSGVNVSNVDLTPIKGAANYSFQVRGSSNVNIDKVHVVGIEGQEGYNHAPFMIRSSTDVSVTNSEFEHAWHGINLLNNQGVRIEANIFHDLRTDGIRGGGNSSITIKNNFFTDFHPQEGDHPDAIQFWTSNTTKSAENITITGNVVFAGQGDPIQGIFMRDEIGTLPYKNVSVTDNVVIGGMYNGIAVDHAINAQVLNNVVAGLGDSKSWLMVKNSTDAVVSGNAATDVQFNGNTRESLNNNVLLQAQYDGGRSLIDQYADHISSILPSKYISVNDLSALVSYSFQAKIASAPAEALVSGTEGNDRLLATNLGTTRIEAGGGNDILTGSTIGANKLNGGAGDDTYNVRNVLETVNEDVGAGNDTVNTSVSFVLGSNVENLKLMVEGLQGTGNDLANRFFGSGGADTILGLGGNDVIAAGEGSDVVFGGAGADTIRGDGGADTLNGDDGADKLFGGTGNDWIDGGAGSDQLEGGAGIDLFSGGAGKDFFTFRNGDLDGTTAGMPEIIADFSRAEGDIIALSLIDARTATSADDGFTWIGTAAFSGRAGQLRYSVADGDAFVSGDVNGDRAADFTLKLDDVTMLSAGDFYL